MYVFDAVRSSPHPTSVKTNASLRPERSALGVYLQVLGVYIYSKSALNLPNLSVWLNQLNDPMLEFQYQYSAQWLFQTRGV